MEETCSWQRREAMRRPGGEGCPERTGELGLEGEAGVFQAENEEWPALQAAARKMRADVRAGSPWE